MNGINLPPSWLKVIGGAALAVALVTGGRSASLVMGGKHVQGEVIEVRSVQTGIGKDHRPRMTALPVVRFLDEDGQPHTVASERDTNYHAWRVGQGAEVVYPAHHPEDARVGAFDNLWLMPMCFGGVGLYLFALGSLRSSRPT